MLASLRSELADAIAKAKTAKGAQSAIDKVIKRYAKSAEIEEAIMRPMAMAAMAGQLMVHAYEVGPKQLSLDIGAAQDARSFLNLPWPEALEAFKRREVGATELETLLKNYRETAGVSRALLLEGIQERVKDMLATAIDQGGTYQEFATAIAEEAPGLGITNQDPAYLQMVFRTNVLGAYGAGRHEALSAPEVVEARPFRQIRTSGDGRVRSDHAAVDGAVYRADNPSMAGLRTPFGYQCRCGIVSLESWDGELLESVPAGLVEPGFE